MKQPFTKKYLYLFFLYGIFLSFFCSPSLTSASDSNTTASTNLDDFQYLYDEGSLLSDSESDEIKKQCKQLSELYDINILILTNENEDNEPKRYVEDLYDANETVWKDAVILYINMTSRGVRIDGYGACEFIFDSDVIDNMLDNITPYLADEDCYNGMLKYLSNVDTIMSQPASADADSIVEKNNSTSFIKRTLINIAISFVIGGIAVGIMAYNSTGRMTANGSTYIDPKHSKILGQWDRYIRTTTTRVPKPKQNSNDTNGFGGGGGISSGGNSHSGGGRNF